MTQKELPLYPKISSIYNKIMQLAIAIIIIVILMNMWFYSYGKNQQALNEHFRFMSKEHLSQIVTSVNFMLTSERSNLQQYVEEVSAKPWIKDLSFYDATGQLMVSSAEQGSIKDLYGLSLYKVDRSNQFTPFIQEIRSKDKLIGYMRLTVENKGLTNELAKTNREHLDLARLMMILGGVVGFLLTRGLNRFSRQGLRLHPKK